jgi:RNA polymerase sigma-70 factor (ECF subfamily)
MPNDDAAPDDTPRATPPVAPGQPSADPTETAELLAALAHDLPRAYPQLLARYQRAIYTFALRLTGTTVDAEDLAQEAFIGAYVSLENYPPERIRSLKLRPWLYRVALNVWRHTARGARLRLVPLDTPTEDGSDSFELPLPDDPQDRPDALIEQGERRQELTALVARLPDRYRVAITCYYLEDLSYQEVADLLDQPVGTVKSTIHRGLRLLRGFIAESPLAPYEDYHCLTSAPTEQAAPLRLARAATSATASFRQSREA